MYCVKCGVRLQDSAETCPLCGTPVWRPEEKAPQADFFAVCGYLLYICLYTGGRWFLSFAFPVVMLFCVVTTASIALFRYVRRGKLFITGGLLVAIGGSTMLVELFQHITFGTQMFHWSLYTASVFAWAGFFLILSGIIRPLREYLERKFFL